MVVRTGTGSVGSLGIDRAWSLLRDTARVVAVAVFVSVSVAVAGAVFLPVAVPVSVRVSDSEPVSIPIDASSIFKFQSQPEFPPYLPLTID
jgi:ABC-type cobalamin transport system permease subunit